MTRTLSASIGAALLTLMLAAPEAGASSVAVTSDSIVVKYSQQEINNGDDAERLYRKLKQASRNACGLDGGYLPLAERMRAERCYEETLSEVVRKIDRPQLTALHESKSPKVSG